MDIACNCLFLFNCVLLHSSFASCRLVLLSKDLLSLPGSEIVSEALDEKLSLFCLVVARILRNALFVVLDMILLFVDWFWNFLCLLSMIDFFVLLLSEDLFCEHLFVLLFIFYTLRPVTRIHFLITRSESSKKWKCITHQSY